MDELTQQERKADLLRLANERFENFLKTQQSIPWAAASLYLELRASATFPPRPQPHKFVP